MADKSYKVVGAAATVYTADRTSAALVTRGGAVPADADNLQHLLDLGLVEAGEVEGGLDVEPDAKPPFALPEDAEEHHAAKKAAAARRSS